jgi:hypothetical protein
MIRGWAFRREFSRPAPWGRRCKGTRFGGDFDVLSAMEGRLVYMEVKSSPPQNIEGDEVHEILLSRAAGAFPGFFFVDTEPRLRDKIVLFLRWRVVRKVPGSIVRNLAVCFRHFLTSAPGLIFPL